MMYGSGFGWQPGGSNLPLSAGTPQAGAQAAPAGGGMAGGLPGIMQMIQSRLGQGTGPAPMPRKPMMTSARTNGMPNPALQQTRPNQMGQTPQMLAQMIFRSMLGGGGVGRQGGYSV